ncbi:MAG: response regulator transcription factor [Sulfurovum sp.]|nr:response regulator transcription factor [Sulfurovum sp.]
MSRKPTLLYAEDNLESRENYTFILAPYFEHIYLASNGEEALALYEQHQPDILLLDISMPLRDGLDVAKVVRNKDSHIPIVMLTAYSDRERLLKAVNLKLDGYLLKPIDDKQLKETMETIFQNIKEQQHTSLLYGLTWNYNTQTLFHNNIQIKLTKKERMLLDILCKKPGNIIQHDTLILHIWEDNIPDHTYTNKLTQLIYRLNKKVSEYLPTGVNLIENSYTMGYRVNIQ